ncbi:MAG: hypothetical protein Q9199_003436 [Rusavskia elegans]
MITTLVPPQSNSTEAPTLSDSRSPNAPDAIPAVKALQDWFVQPPIFKPNPHATNSNKEQEDQEFKPTQTTFKQALMEIDTESFLAVLRIFSANPRAQVDLVFMEILSAKLSQEGVWADIQSDPEFKLILDDRSNRTRAYDLSKQADRTEMKEAPTKIYKKTGYIYKIGRVIVEIRCRFRQEATVVWWDNAGFEGN